MLSLCKATVHTLLGFPDNSHGRRNPPYRYRNIPSPDAAGLRLLAENPPKQPNVIESAAVGSAEKLPEWTDPGTRGLHDLQYGNLRLCTENLGAESCDDAGVGIDEIGLKDDDRRSDSRPWGGRRRTWRRRAEAKFPPPLPWLAGRDGRRSQFMRAVRKDGRIVLTEVRIERPEVLRASRRDGRLRLELVGDPNVRVISHQENEEEEEEEEDNEEENGEEEERASEEEETPPPASPWLKSEGTRCVEAASGNGIPPWWRDHFVTTA